MASCLYQLTSSGSSGVRVDLLRDDVAVAKLQDAVCDRRERLVVRDQHHRGARLLVDLAKHLEHELAGAEVEVAGRLVAENQLGCLGQCSRDRDTLLLAARQLRGEVVRPLGESDLGEKLCRVEVGAVTVTLGELEGEADVLLGGQRGDQVEELEDEADVLAAEERELSAVKVEMSCSPKVIDPLVGASIPPSRFSSVVLPEPDGPRIATNSPRLMVSSSTCRASTSTSPIL